MAKNVIYNGTEFKCIDRIPEYAAYHSIYVAKEAQVDEHGREYQAINTNYYGRHALHVLYSYPNNRGYQLINLPRLNGKKQRCVTLHRLVFLTWCEEWPANYQELDINHRDENKCNNSYGNLEMISHAQNCRYGHRATKWLATMVKHGATARIVAYDMQAIQEYHFDTIRECARTLDLDRRAIYRCLAGQQRQHKGFVFCREDGIVNN